MAEAIATVRKLTSGAIGVNLFVPQPRHCTAAQLRAFAAALSLEAADYGVTLGRPCHDDDDWAAKLDVVCDLRPEPVAEVSYDHASGGRIRHGARLLRFRDDRDPASCTADQLEA